MKAVYSYDCKDYPGMEKCSAHFAAETREEIIKLIELHASIAHGENPAQWSKEDKSNLEALIKFGAAD